MDAVSLLTLGLSLILGSFYTLVVGFGNMPFGLQESLGHLLMLAATCVLLRKRGVGLSRLQQSYVALAGGIAVYAAITTNPLVRGVSTFSIVFVESFLLLGLFRTRGFVNSATLYVSSLLKYFALGFYHGIYQLITFQILRVPSGQRLQKTELPKPRADVVAGIFFTIPTLVIFHIFFAQINSEYGLFVGDILHALWELLKIIINIDFIVLLLKLYVASSVFYTLFTVSEAKPNKPVTPQQKALLVVTMVLCATILLFGLFSFFQSKLLFLNYAALAFKALSLYTQRGFWELVTVSILGYGLCLFVFGRIKDHTPQTYRLKQLLSVFTIQLIVITIFSYHKLGILQVVFGLKDQRLLATVAVLLITMTCILFLLRIWGKIAPSRIFVAQVLGLLTATLLFNIINLDLFVTTTYPIRYVVAGKVYKDYSYLLGNSYDNTSQWLGLMSEAEKIGVPMPEQYYWGWYQPLCVKEERSRYGYPLSVISPVTSSYLEQRYAALQKKYEALSWRQPLPQLTRVNVHEYQAYMLLKEHKAAVDTFITFAKNVCN